MKRLFLLGLLSCAALASPPAPAQLAAPAANVALDAAYAKFATRKDAVAPKRTAPWVTPENAKVSGSAKTGYTVTWAQFAPAGFEFEATVSVSSNGTVKVLKASALYSPD